MTIRSILTVILVFACNCGVLRACWDGSEGMMRWNLGLLAAVAVGTGR